MHLREYEGGQGHHRAVAVAIEGHEESPQSTATQAGPVSDLISLQILNKPPTHPLACGKISSNISHSFHLVY